MLKLIGFIVIELQGYIFRRVSLKEDAEDILQNIFYKLSQIDLEESPIERRKRFHSQSEACPDKRCRFTRNAVPAIHGLDRVGERFGRNSSRTTACV
jgi:hypothetical protein